MKDKLFWIYKQLEGSHFRNHTVLFFFRCSIWTAMKEVPPSEGPNIPKDGGVGNGAHERHRTCGRSIFRSFGWSICTTSVDGVTWVLDTLPATNSSPLKIGGSEMKFLLGPGLFCFRGGRSPISEFVPVPLNLLKHGTCPAHDES